MFGCLYKLVIQTLWKTICKVLQKLKIDLSHEPVNLLLDIYPEEIISVQNTPECTCLLFHYSKQLRCGIKLDVH